jgi:hypothetical protein
MTYPTLNRRHKVGLFLVLVAAGISLFFEASEKQTTGIILLGLAATWLVGTLSVRLLWLLSSFLGCLVAIIVGGKPVVDDSRSFQESVQSYERAVADLRAAVVKSRPLYVVKTEPLPRRSNESTGTTPAVDYDALAKKYGAISSSSPTIDWSNYDGTMTVFDYNPRAKKWNIAAAPGWVPVEEPKAEAKKSPKQSALPPLPSGYTLDVTVEVPTTTVSWERPDLGLLPPGATLVTGSVGTRLSFPSNVDEEELISTVKNQLLKPRPRFSLRACLISNLLPSIIGFVLLAAGLFSLGWCVRNVVRAKGAHAQQIG